MSTWINSQFQVLQAWALICHYDGSSTWTVKAVTGSVITLGNYTSQSRAQDVVNAFIADQGFWDVVSSVPSSAGDALLALNPLSPNLAEGTPSGSNFFWDIAGVNYYITGSAWTAVTNSAGNYSFPAS